MLPRLKRYLLLHLPHLSLRGTNKKTTLRKSCSISAHLSGGDTGYTGREEEGSVIDATGQGGRAKYSVMDDTAVEQQLISVVKATCHNATRLFFHMYLNLCCVQCI